MRARPPEPASIRVMALVLQELGCWAGNSRISICVRFGTVRRRASNPISPSRVCCPPVARARASPTIGDQMDPYPSATQVHCHSAARPSAACTQLCACKLFVHPWAGQCHPRESGSSPNAISFYSRVQRDQLTAHLTCALHLMLTIFRTVDGRDQRPRILSVGSV